MLLISRATISSVFFRGLLPGLQPQSGAGLVMMMPTAPHRLFSGPKASLSRIHCRPTPTIISGSRIFEGAYRYNRLNGDIELFRSEENDQRFHCRKHCALHFCRQLRGYMDRHRRFVSGANPTGRTSGRYTSRTAPTACRFWHRRFRPTTKVTYGVPHAAAASI